MSPGRRPRWSEAGEARRVIAGGKSRSLRETPNVYCYGVGSAKIAPFGVMCGDPGVMQYIFNGSTRSAEQAARAIVSFEKERDEKRFGLFAIESKQAG